MNKAKLTACVLGIALVVGACSNEPDPAALAAAREAAVAEYQAQETARLAENKRIASAFFAPGVTAEQRYELLHDDYIQHNPAFKKFADENGLGYKEGFKQMMARNAAGPPPGGGPGGPGGNANAPQPPQGDPLYMVLAEADRVFIMRQQYRQDPTKEPGNFYESFAWDVFSIKDGKLYEHWDGGMINPPPAAAPAAGGRAGPRPNP